MNKLKRTQTLVGLSIFSVLTGFSLNVQAGGFQLNEENVTNLGNAFAGAGAQADDASTEFFNPAGMTRLESPQVLVAGTLIHVNAKVHVQSATNTTIGNIQSSQQVFGSSNLSPGGFAVIPAFHFVYPITANFAAGFGINAPFGLSTDYSDTSMVRHLATESDLQAIDLGPSFAYQLTPNFSFGAGLDVEYLSADFDQIIADPTGQLPGLGTFDNEGEDWGLGWHGGVLYQPDACTRYGLTYHSRIDHTIRGRAIANLTQGRTVGDFGGNFSADAILPDTIDLSAYHDLNSQWSVLGSLDYTRWSSIQAITAKYSGLLSNLVSSAQLPFDLRDTFRLSGGLNYRPDDKWTLRTGLAWDESPVKSDTERTFRLPDSDRIWLALGAQYIINRRFTVDAGYAHLFVMHSHINNTQQFSGNAPGPGNPPIILSFTTLSNAVADVDSSVNELGVQLIWNIV